MTDAASPALLVLAYIFAVVDGTLQDKGVYPSEPGRTGLQLYARQHPWILIGGACGIAGSVRAVV